jgi:hypothetical protein
MRFAIAALALLPSLAHAEVTSKAGPTKIVDAGAAPRRVLRLGATGVPEKLRCKIAFQTEEAPLSVAFELRVTPAGPGTWTAVATALDLSSPMVPKSAGDKLREVAERIAKGVTGRFHVDAHGRFSDAEWTVPEGGDRFESGMRRATHSALAALGEFLPMLGSVLPDGAVGAGASWSSSAEERKQIGDDGVTMMSDARWTVTGLDERGAKLKVAAKLTVPSTVAKGEKVSLKGTMEGTERIETGRALPSALRVESVMDVEAGEQKMSMKATIEVELIK